MAPVHRFEEILKCPISFQSQLRYIALLFFLFNLAKKYKATAQMYRLTKDVQITLKKKHDNQFDSKNCICDRGQLVSFLFLIFINFFNTVRYRKITLHNLYSKLPSDLLTLEWCSDKRTALANLFMFQNPYNSSKFWDLLSTI